MHVTKHADSLTVAPYTDTIDTVDYATFKKKYFAAWNNRIVPRKKDTDWSIKKFEKKALFGENFHEHDSLFLTGLYANAHLDNFPSAKGYGITTEYTDIKILPTHKPIFYSFQQAGEGFPFDNNQNSSLWPNTPVQIVHASQDGRWVFISSANSVGWIKRSCVAFVDNTIIKQYQIGSLISTVYDNISIYRQDGKYLHQAMIGSVYPVVDNTVYSVAKNENDSAVLCAVKLDSSLYVEIPYSATSTNIKSIAHRFLGTKYGWGGMYENRDCSSMLRDLFIPFGLMLPRNSSGQQKFGNKVSIDTLSTEAKQQRIVSKAVPYKTLLYKRGHIMLYIGHDENDAYILHDTWGIKTHYKDQFGRIIFGGAIISSINLGQDVTYIDHTLLDDITSFNFLFK